jgi:hypothetical protein
LEAFCTGSTAALAKWCPSPAAFANCPPVKCIIFIENSGANAPAIKRPTPPIKLEIAEITLVEPRPAMTWNPVMRMITRTTLLKMRPSIISAQRRHQLCVHFDVVPEKARGARTAATTMST